MESDLIRAAPQVEGRLILDGKLTFLGNHRDPFCGGLRVGHLSLARFAPPVSSRSPHAQRPTQVGILVSWSQLRASYT